MQKIYLNHKTIFVTGAAGFIGSNLVKRLLNELKGAKIIGIDNMNDYYDVAIKEYRLNQLSELINQYNIYESAIIVNLRKNIKIDKKRFNGITINDYDISFESVDELNYERNNKYKACEIYEGQINKKQPFQDVMKKIEKDKVKITKLLGKNNDFGDEGKNHI